VQKGPGFIEDHLRQQGLGGRGAKGNRRETCQPPNTIINHRGGRAKKELIVKQLKEKKKKREVYTIAAN